ncbi:hypothetical protein AB0A95_13345 [Micromonospora sp. NPDC049230]|uniref:hypothetical protein n=1 Tax=Micromonospora sp. NPDC049230 TaxID=3155502 RepID=UPI0033C37E80
MSPSNPYGVLIDPHAPAAIADWLDLPATKDVYAVADVAEYLLDISTDLTYLGLLVDHIHVGTINRSVVDEPVKSLDAAAGQLLPGQPHYELVQWRCRTCDTRLWRIHVDPRDPPTCPNNCGRLYPHTPS